MCKICNAIIENAARPTPAPYDSNGALQQLQKYIIVLREQIRIRKDEKERAGQTSLF